MVNNVAPQFEAGGDETLEPPVSGVFSRNISFTDPGQDIWTGTVNFGDTTGDQALTIDQQNKSFILGHTYTVEGTYGVTVTVLDDDGGYTDTFQVEVFLNTPPVADAGGPYTIDEGANLTLNGSGSWDREDNIVSWQWDLDNDGQYDDATGATTTITWMDDGLFTVGLKVTDSYGEFDSDTTTVIVTNVAPSLEITNKTQNIQYSDPIEDITIAAKDPGTDTLSATTSALPKGLVLSGGNGNWSISGIADTAPGEYVIDLVVSDEDGGKTEAEIAITVKQEDAVATYAGPLLVSTPSINDPVATVELRAVIRDITAVTPAADPDEGNIPKATVTFVNRDDTNNPVIAANVPVGLLDPADPKTGVAVFNWQVNLGTKNSDSFTVGVVVDGYYDRDDSGDNTVVTVSKPLDNFITGGGYLVNSASAGAYAGDPGLKTNFGFNVKFNKQLTNLQGKFTAIVRDGDHVYQIKTNATDSLVVNPTTKTATFVSKANLVDITNPLAPVSIAGNLSLIVTLTDRGEPGASDLIGFTLWKGSQLWFSSNWTGAQTLEQVLAGGNLVVHAGAALQAADGVATVKAEGPALSQDLLQPIVDEAISRFATSGIGSDRVNALDAVEFRIGDLDGSTLGLVVANTVWIDADAAGYGWFIDTTPADDREFRADRGSGDLLANESTDAYGRMDLLTVVMHELGHVLGFGEGDPKPYDLMSETLDAGTREVYVNTDGIKAVLTGDHGKVLGRGGGNGHRRAGALVAMDLPASKRFRKESFAASIHQNPWLFGFLTNAGRENEGSGPNDTIRLVIPDGEDT
jgi:hypothetical protein